MNIENFTPASTLIGGALIGLSATLLLWLTGRSPRRGNLHAH